MNFEINPKSKDKHMSNLINKKFRHRSGYREYNYGQTYNKCFMRKLKSHLDKYLDFDCFRDFIFKQKGEYGWTSHNFQNW
jgi:hypothetical protein